MDKDSRNKIIAASGVSAMVAGATLLAYGGLVEPRWLDVRHITLQTDPQVWPKEMPPFTVAHLSDLHIGGYGPLGVIREAIRVINAAKPDAIALTGDIIGSKGDGSLAASEQAIDLLGHLQAGPIRLAVLGNHDHLIPNSARRLSKMMADAGWHILNNSALRIEYGGLPIWVVGVDDPTTSRDNYAKATSDLNPADQPRLLLSHWPDLAVGMRPIDAAVTLSGHTHGGHIDLPVLLQFALRRAGSHFRAGQYSVNGTQLYVSRGLGGSRIPIRIGARPEVAIITIQS